MVARNDPDFDPRESDFRFGSNAAVKPGVRSTADRRHHNRIIMVRLRAAPDIGAARCADARLKTCQRHQLERLSCSSILLRLKEPGV